MKLRLLALLGLFCSTSIVSQVNVWFHADDPSGSSASTREAFSLKDILGDTPQARRLEQSFGPYLVASEAAGKPAVRPVTEVPSDSPEYMVGDDVVMVPPVSPTDCLPVTLPEGLWVNALTGAQSSGGTSFQADVLGGSIPIWMRGGSLLERCVNRCSDEPAPRSNVASTLDACQGGCLVDVLPPYSADQVSRVKDSGGRVLTRSGNTLTIEGQTARMTVRWRFSRKLRAEVNGIPVKLQTSADGYYIRLDHAGHSTVTWAVAEDPLKVARRRSYAR